MTRAARRVRRAGFSETIAAVGLGVLLGTLFATAAPADVLVLRDGSRLETRGTWTEKGRQLVFTDPSGKLASIRLDLVDLDASRAATAKAAEPQAPEPAPQLEDRPVVLVLKDTDLGLGSDPDLSGPPADVVLYATSWCGWCRKTRELFAELGVAFVERDVEASQAARLERNRLAGGDGVPVVDWRGREVVRGFSESQFRELARQDAEADAERERERLEADSEAEAEVSPDSGEEPSSGDSTGEPPPQPSYGS